MPASGRSGNLRWPARPRASKRFEEEVIASHAPGWQSLQLVEGHPEGCPMQGVRVSYMGSVSPTRGQCRGRPSGRPWRCLTQLAKQLLVRSRHLRDVEIDGPPAGAVRETR